MIIGGYDVSARIHNGEALLTVCRVAGTPFVDNEGTVWSFGASPSTTNASTSQPAADKVVASRPVQSKETAGVRVSWTLERKIEVAKYAIEHGNDAAAEKFGCSKGTVATHKSHYNTGKLV